MSVYMSPKNRQVHTASKVAEPGSEPRVWLPNLEVSPQAQLPLPDLILLPPAAPGISPAPPALERTPDGVCFLCTRAAGP